MADDEVPKHIKKFESLKEKADRIADTTGIAHSEAYVKAANAHLKDDDGNIDLKKLDDADIRTKFVDKMSDHYIKAANDYFKTDFKGDDIFQVDQLMKAYTGITKTHLGKLVDNYGKGYTLNRHDQTRDQLIKDVKEQLHASAASHLKDKHVGDFVKYMKAEDVLDASKMRIEDAINVHEMYDHGNVISQKMIKENMGPRVNYLKKKKAA